MAYVTKVTRTYSKSINLKTYGLPESWIKIESTQEAQCESNDDVLALSTMLADSVQKDVVTTLNGIVAKIQQKQVPAAQSAPSAAPPVSDQPQRL